MLCGLLAAHQVNIADTPKLSNKLAQHFNRTLTTL